MDDLIRTYLNKVRYIDIRKTTPAAINHIQEEMNEWTFAILQYSQFSLRMKGSDPDTWDVSVRRESNKLMDAILDESADVINLLFAFLARLGLDNTEAITVLLRKTAARDASLKGRRLSWELNK